MMRQDNNARRNEEYTDFAARRNPYLMDYEIQRKERSPQKTDRSRVSGNRRVRRETAEAEIVSIIGHERAASQLRGQEKTIRPQEKRYAGSRGSKGDRSGTGARRQYIESGAGAAVREQFGVFNEGAASRVRSGTERGRRYAEPGATVSRQSGNERFRVDLPLETEGGGEDCGRRSAAPQRRNITGERRQGHSRENARRAALKRRRVRMQRLVAGVWVVCILVLAGALLIRGQRMAAAGSGQTQDGFEKKDRDGNGGADGFSGSMVQGLPAEVFAGHPDWEENLLTPNEYSRPGEALESVKNIFVHYTANPGTSAAQNRSYFEQQKDTHEISVSSHFIIGYEGEIIQCVPLDEIAYAVMTRNYDSISIECCYLKEDGSFTQETYDSLISLLAWLTDAYGLDTEDILRHYDCGGKKCPLYYTNHEDAWEQLKKDVDKL